MSDFQHQAIRLTAQQQPLSWLEAIRNQATDAWLAQPWPTRKTEHWKYTPMQGLQKTQLHSLGSAANPILNSAQRGDLIPLDAYQLVFVDGVFDAEHSSSLPNAVVRFSQANAEQQALIEKYLGKIVEGERHLFATLNNAWLEDGVLVHVPRNQRLEKPVYIVNVITAVGAASNQRLLIVLDENSQAEVVEHYCSSADVQNSFANALTEIHVGENASLHH